VGVGDNSTQLKQLENTVEQLKSHFVQLLQHLPLTTSQQQQYANGATLPNVPPISQLLQSTPTSISTSTPNAQNPHAHHLATSMHPNAQVGMYAQDARPAQLGAGGFAGFSSTPQSAAFPNMNVNPTDLPPPSYNQYQ